MFTGTRLILPKLLPDDSTVLEKDGTTVTLDFTKKRSINNANGVRICNYVIGKVCVSLSPRFWTDVSAILS